MVELIYQDETYAVIGAAMEVHNALGCGFLEAVYQEALEMEFTERGIPYFAQKELPIYYKGRKLNKIYVADFVVFDKIIVEIKALDQLTPRETAQLINYLKATGLEVGLLLNFGAESMKWERKVLTHLSPLHPLNPRHPRIKQENL
jgi:GxxExxY protein